MTRHKVIGLFMALAIPSCVTNAYKTRDAWMVHSASQEFQREKLLYKERTGGKELCASIGISFFAWPGTPPDKGCIYSSGGYFRDPQAEDTSMHLNQLKVLQVMPRGYLVGNNRMLCNANGATCYQTDERSPNWIFVYKDDEEGIVDGSFLDSNAEKTKLYEYAGAYTYESVLGAPKTVHSFKVFPRQKAKDAKNGLKVYDPTEELFAQLGLWNKLEASLSKSQKPRK